MSADTPNGADSLLEAALDAGVEVCFANPGTTEMDLVSALDRNTAIRPVLGLFEGVVTGAADGYGRMTGRPALTLLHLGPGLANGIANLHNARRAHSPVVNLVGDHATWHRGADAPLTSDIDAIAGAVGSVVTPASVDDLATVVQSAIATATGPPASVVTVVVPQDLAWTGTTIAAPPTPVAHRVESIDEVAVSAAIDRLSTSPTTTALIVGGDGLCDAGVRAASRIAAATGAAVWAEMFSSRIERGGGLPTIRAVPYFPEMAIEALGAIEHAVLVGTDAPVSFFGYPDQPSRLLPGGCEVIGVSAGGHPAAAALWEIADRVGAAAFTPIAVERPPRPSGGLSTKTLGAALAATQPEHAVVVNEAATSGNPWLGMSAAAPSHDMLGLTGGAIGQGLPCAVGAAVACPDRPVVALQADGSGLYTLQALWTMARESLDVTVVVCANRAYRILQVELQRSGASLGPASERLMELDQPAIDWVSVGRGFGVPSVSVDTAEALVTELDRAFAEPGPTLIEALL